LFVHVNVCSLNKIPRKRPTFNALLEHPWLLPLSPSRRDFAEVVSTNKTIMGEWVIESLANKKRSKEEDNPSPEEERVKPPLHAVERKQ
jgi:hypothetical protein